MLGIVSTFQRNVTTKLRNRTQPALSKMFAKADNFCRQYAISHLNNILGTCCNRLLPAQNAGTTHFVSTIRQNRHVTAAGTWPYRQECAERVGHCCSTWLNLCAERTKAIMTIS